MAGGPTSGEGDMSQADRAPSTPPDAPHPEASPPDAAPGSAPPPSASDDALGKTVAELTADDVEPGQRKRLLGRMVSQVRARGVGDLFKPKVALRWMTDAISDIAPHVPVRDLETLRRHHEGLDGEALAERLVRNASRATAGVGAAGGGVAAVEWAAAPTLLSAPVLLAAETVGVVAIELKLVGELHEVYGVPIAGVGGQRAMSLVHSWSQQRGVNPMLPGVGVGMILGTAARKDLRDRILKRVGRNLTSLGPFLTGAAVASYLNRRATLSLGARIRDDLRKQHRKVIDGSAR
jgi:hypothetical protein